MTEARIELPDVETIRELLEFDTDTGLLFWRYRSLRWFQCAGSQASWNKRYSGKLALNHIRPDGYKMGCVFGKPHLTHRVIWAISVGEWANGEIDHINGIRTDNRMENLREASRRQNVANQKVRRDNYSGMKGVHYDKRTGRYNAIIYENGVKRRLGSFMDAKFAFEAYRRESMIIHGDYACISTDRTIQN